MHMKYFIKNFVSFSLTPIQSVDILQTWHKDKWGRGLNHGARQNLTEQYRHMNILSRYYLL